MHCLPSFGPDSELWTLVLWLCSCSVASGMSCSYNSMNYGPPGSSVQGISRQECCSGLPCLPLGNLPNSEIELSSPVSLALQAYFLLLSRKWSPSSLMVLGKLRARLSTCWGPLMDRNLVVPSWRWESERRKEANIPWVTKLAFALQGISEKQRERERERHRDPSSDGTRVLYWIL